MPHDRSNPAFGLNSVLVNPAVSQSTAHGFPDRLSPCASCGGLDLQGCVLRRFVSPASRGYLRVPHPVFGGPGVYLSSGLAPWPVCTGRCIRPCLRVADSVCPALRMVNFVADLRVVELRGVRNQVSIGMARLMGLLWKLGIRFHAKGPGRRWPCKSIPRSGFTINALFGKHS